MGAFIPLHLTAQLLPAESVCSVQGTHGMNPLSASCQATAPMQSSTKVASSAGSWEEGEKGKLFPTDAKRIVCHGQTPVSLA